MNCLVRKLEHYALLSETEKSALRSALVGARRHTHNRASVAAATPAHGLTVVLEGFAYRYKLLAVGRRQICGYLVAGDICGLRASALRRHEYCIGTFGPAETATLAPDDILSDPERFPNLSKALWCSMLAEQSVARGWITNVGPRTAYERVAHLFCELFVRLQSVGLTREHRCTLPLSQRDLADALALSSMHVNRGYCASCILKGC